jgi:3-oxo-5alpha-steroid 4-dehydrogenase
MAPRFEPSSGVPAVQATFQIGAAERIGDADAPEARWDHETDVLVVGFGGAGATASLEARQRGVDVIVADRFGGGGATAFSGGVIYAGGTPFQRAAGFEDTPDAMFRYLSMEYKGCVSNDTLRRFCEGSRDDVRWLASHGVPFSGDAVLGKTAYPPDDKYLYFSGNEKVAAYAAQAAPAPRGHRAVGTGFTGYVFFARLQEAVIRSGARIMPYMSARRLIVDRAGRVVGVEFMAVPEAHRAEHQAIYDRVHPHKPFGGTAAEEAIRAEREFVARVGVPCRVRARQGVILATGGFVYNLDMLAKYRPELAERQAALARLGSMGCQGNGIELGQSVGGATRYMDSAFVARLVAPPNGLIKGIAVNRNGNRFINEEIYCGFFGDAIARQPEATGWIILDAKGFWTVVRECLNFDKALFKIYLLPTLMNLMLGGTKKARTLAGLARKLGMPVGNLQGAIDANNRAAAGTEDDAFGKSPANRAAIGKGPFYAVNISTANKYSFTQVFTLGGLEVDEETGGVLNEHGEMVEGLYAAGRAAVGLCSIGYVSGMAIADAVFSGRRAGSAAAARAAAPKSVTTVK